MKLPRNTIRSSNNQDQELATRVTRATTSEVGLPAMAILSRPEMDEALAVNLAQHLSPLITDFIHHRNYWWVAYPGGWLRVDDAELSQLLNSQKERFV